MYCIYLKSVTRHNCLILDTYHLDILYLREQRCEDPWLFFEAKTGPLGKKFGKHCYRPKNFDLRDFIRLFLKLSYRTNQTEAAYDKHSPLCPPHYPANHQHLTRVPAKRWETRWTIWNTLNNKKQQRTPNLQNSPFQKNSESPTWTTPTDCPPSRIDHCSYDDRVPSRH
jgi:hypothetical protein